MGNHKNLVICAICLTFIHVQYITAQVQTVTVRQDSRPDFLTEATPLANKDVVTSTQSPSTTQRSKDKDSKTKDEERFKKVTGTEPAQFWKDVAQSALKEREAVKPIEKIAKNIIYFIGDGMSVSTITAARIFKGQQEKYKFGEEAELHMEKFPFLGASKTFCSDAQVADSACSATALFSGSKTNFKTIGVAPSVLVGNCTEQMKRKNHLSSILEWAQREGKSTGIVTTTRISHATPAGTYAHIAHRDWENDVEVMKSGMDPNECDDIAEQLILNEPGKNINVIMGGGRKHLLPSTVMDSEHNTPGARNDSKNLIEMWRKQKENLNSAYVETVEDLLKINPNEVDYLLGLFSPDHIEYVDNRTDYHDPSLLDMTKVAIEILRKNPRGYFLMVEAGRIDHSLHENMGQRALAEAVECDKVVKLADEMTNDEDTLITVTADHSHVMTIAGYPVRGNPILGIAEDSDVDGLPYTTISFANGPGFRNHTNGMRPNITGDNIFKIDYRHYTGIPLKYETHGGEDVFIFSKGPYAHLLTGVNLQNYIPHVMAYAACIGSEQGMAQSPLCQEQNETTRSAASVQISISFSCFSSLFIFAIFTKLIIKP